MTALVDVFDADGDKVTLTYEWSAGGTRLSGPRDSAVLSRVRKGDSVNLTVTASDGKDKTQYKAKGRVQNSPPVVDGVQMNATMDGMLTATPVAHDNDEDPMTFTYQWEVNGRLINDHQPSLEIAKYKTGTEVVVVVVADDGEDESAKTKSVPYNLRNNKPAIVSRPDSIDTVGMNTLRYQVKAEDPNLSQRLQYRLEEGPEGMKIDTFSGELTWTPHAGQEGEFPVRILVDDMNGGTATQSFSVTAGLE